MEDFSALTDDELLDAMAEEYPTYEATIQFAAQGLNATEDQEEPQASAHWQQLHDEAARRKIEGATDEAALRWQHGKAD